MLEKYCTYSFLREGVKSNNPLLANIKEDMTSIVQCFIWCLKQRKKEEQNYTVDRTETMKDIEYIKTDELLNFIRNELEKGTEKEELLKLAKNKFGTICTDKKPSKQILPQ